MRIRFFIPILLLSTTLATAQNERCIMPQGWYGLTPFKWKSSTLADSSMCQITSIQVTLGINHSWGFGGAKYTLEYGLRDSLFETRTTHLDHSGKTYPPKEKGQGAINKDSLFQRQFAAEQLFRVLRNIQLPSPYWTEADFGYTRERFRTDLMQLPRSRMSGSKNCEDCSRYDLNISFLKGEKIIATITSHFDSGFRLPTVRDTGIKQFKVQSMLEWMYLYQLCHLFFPENVALNKSHFNEKSIDNLAIWANKMFPELNKYTTDERKKH